MKACIEFKYNDQSVFFDPSTVQAFFRHNDKCQTLLLSGGGTITIECTKDQLLAVLGWEKSL